MFKTLIPLSIVSERTAVNYECGKLMDMGKLFISNYLGRFVWKLSVQGQFFFQITIYQGFTNNQVNLWGFFSPLGLKVKLKFYYREISND
jgi:hypothetical protein